MKRFFGCVLALVVACGDILVAPGEPSATSNPAVAIGVDSGAITLGQAIPAACPTFEPVALAVTSVTDDAGIHLEPVDIATGCAVSGGACEYGSSADKSCDRTYTCQSGGWRNTTALGGNCFDGTCPNETLLRATLDGTLCDLGPVGTPTDEAICNVADGTCACTTGAANGHPHARHWACSQSVLSCPLHRPRVGTTCGSDGIFCDYGSCVSKRGSAVICQNGQWVETPTTCN